MKIGWWAAVSTKLPFRKLNSILSVPSANRAAAIVPKAMAARASSAPQHRDLHR
jgi:hypothetical protein